LFKGVGFGVGEAGEVVEEAVDEVLKGLGGGGEGSGGAEREIWPRDCSMAMIWWTANMALLS
jgi:hypothetical protein